MTSNGIPGTMIAPEQHNATRRAAKARQRKNHSGSSTATHASQGLLQGLAEDRRARRDALRQPDAHFALGSVHAGMALNHEAFTSLAPGSLSRKLAQEAIAQFPLVEKSASMSRKVVAFKAAVETLSFQESRRHAAVAVARRAFMTAMTETHEAAWIEFTAP